MSRADYLSFEAEQKNQIAGYSDDISVILSQTEKISEITRNVLQHSKKTEKNFGEVDLSEVVETTLTTLQQILKKRNVELSKSLLQHKAVIKGNALQVRTSSYKPCAELTRCHEQ